MNAGRKPLKIVWKPRVFKRYEIKCPNCNYKYAVEVSSIPEWERCPNCGHGDSFGKFWQPVVSKVELRERTQ